MPNKNAVKKPMKKAPVNNRPVNKSKKAPAKSRAISKEKQSTAEINQVRLHENPIAMYAIQFIMGLVAVYILISFLMTGVNDVGGIGVFFRNIFYGLFGGAAFLMPFFLGSISFFLRRDLESGFFKYRVIFSLSCLILYASIMHLSSSESAEAGFAAQLMFENGKAVTGGGIFGGFLSEILRRSVGQIGAWIFILPLSFTFSIFLFGRTPLDLFRVIIQLIKEYQAAQKKSSEIRVDHRTNLKTKIIKEKNPVNTENINIKVDNFDGFDVDKNDNNIDDFSDLENVEEIPTSKNRKRLIDINPFNKEKQENVEPVMIPNKEIFFQNIVDEIKSKKEDDSGIAEIEEIINFDDNVEFSKIKEDLEVDLANLQIIDSAPQARDDEPELEKSISFETSQVFEVEAEPKKEYKFPPISYLAKDTNMANADYSEELRTTAEKLISTLASFGVKTKIYGCSRGPSITRYEIAPDSGTKVRAITNLVDDIALNLATDGVRIEAPIPGKAAVGVEVPNKNVSIVHLRTLLEEPQFTNAASKVTIALGVDVADHPIYSDVAKMPHLLIAGATGTGKSVCINSIITSILYKAKPNEVKLILIDPKKVELSIYDGIPHLLVPVVSDPKKAAGTLAWAVNEMENRYMLLQEKSVRNLENYNKVVADDPLAEPLPQIVIIIDELADLMMTAPVDVEQSICRLAQKARAAGMHLILGTQRPSVDVITGLIKANIPSRIAFTVASQINSNIILDSGGAEKLIGRGDMLYLPTGSLKPMRIQGAFVSEKDVLNVVEFWKKQSDGVYDQTVLDEIDQEAARTNTKGAKMKDKDDDISAGDELKKDSALKPAIEIAIDTGRISTSLLQTKLSLGYARAARIINTMEKMNIIGPFEGSKPRKVLITREEFIEMTMNNNLD